VDARDEWSLCRRCQAGGCRRGRSPCRAANLSNKIADLGNHRLEQGAVDGRCRMAPAQASPRRRETGAGAESLGAGGPPLVGSGRPSSTNIGRATPDIEQDHAFGIGSTQPALQPVAARTPLGLAIDDLQRDPDLPRTRERTPQPFSAARAGFGRDHRARVTPRAAILSRQTASASTAGRRSPARRSGRRPRKPAS